MGGQLLVTGGDRPVPLEPVDEALDPVALPVGGAVEPPGAALVAPGRDHRADPPPQLTLRLPAAVALVPGHALGAQLRPPAPRPLDRPRVQQRRQ